MCQRLKLCPRSLWLLETNQCYKDFENAVWKGLAGHHQYGVKIRTFVTNFQLFAVRKSVTTKCKDHLQRYFQPN